VPDVDRRLSARARRSGSGREGRAIAGSLREFRPDRRRRLGSAHRGEGCRRSQQAG
jgi:hypothetical protein